MALPNLARDPFVNLRPLRRTGRLLLILGIALSLLNLFLFASYLLDSADLRSRLRDLRSEVAQERDAIDQASRRLAAFDLEAQNQRVEFLNQRIAHRRFLWSQLFEDLGEVLPPGVRLNALSPEIERRRSTGQSRDRIPLSMVGEARDSEQLLDLVDALFAHPAFGEPKLASENRSDSLLEFALSVDYLTARPSPAEESDDAELQTTAGSGEKDAGASEALPVERAATEGGTAEPREAATESVTVPDAGEAPSPSAEARAEGGARGSIRAEEVERRSMTVAPSTSGSPTVASQGSGRSTESDATRAAGVTVAGTTPGPGRPPSTSGASSQARSSGADGAPGPRATTASPGAPPDASPRRPAPRQPDASSPPGAAP